jgi:hypothetical protein
MKISRMTFSTNAFSIKPSSRVGHSRNIFSRITFSIMTLSRKILSTMHSVNVIQHHDTLHGDMTVNIMS